MTPDELKAIPKGSFVVMKTGTHPMQTKLRLFLDWGITFGAPYQTPDHGQRKVYYADRRELEAAIRKKHPPAKEDAAPAPAPVPVQHGAEQSKLRYTSRTSRRSEGSESSMRP